LVKPLILKPFIFLLCSDCALVHEESGFAASMIRWCPRLHSFGRMVKTRHHQAPDVKKKSSAKSRYWVTFLETISRLPTSR
jgi:hypothetical protein